ncbi:MAG: hypothetical protein U0V04_03330 [Spirosomataceae bacterium]
MAQFTPEYSLSKKANQDVEFKTRIAFTLDADVCPLTSQSGISYGELRLGKVPILYFVWVDVQEVLREVKGG